MAPNTPSQLHTPRLAELIADSLRRKILSGELADGEALPNQESLLAEFGISKPPLREALRILESEGLITVRRGSVGGALVHIPEARHAAQTLSMVLQAQGATVEDVGGALLALEGVCAQLCADRQDRDETVLPHLRRINARAREAVRDKREFFEAMASFHRQLVALSGNLTMQLVAGSTETLWFAHVREWVETSPDPGPQANMTNRWGAIETHEHITDLIARGDGTNARYAANSHTDYTLMGDRSRRIDAAVLKMAGS